MRFSLSPFARWTLSALTALGLACSSPPTRFYLLSSVPGEAAEQGATQRGPLVLAVGPVSIPSYVDRPQIVTRDGPNAAAISDFDQWAGSLQDMTSRVLAEDLASRLPGDRVLPFPGAGDVSFDYRVAVNVSRFDVDPQGAAAITSSWQIFAPGGGKALLAGETNARSAGAGSSYDERVAALSRAIGVLSDDVARALARLPASAASSAGAP